MPRRDQYTTTDQLQVVRLDDLVLLDELQVRVRLDQETVHEYQQIFQDVPEAKCTCPPIVVFAHHGTLVVSDGFHRVTAAKRAGRTTLQAYVHTGTLDDAWMTAMQTNITHGKKYTRDDHTKIVLWLLNHPRYGTCSTRELAALTGGMVTHGTVANIKNRHQRPPAAPPAPVVPVSPQQPPPQVLSKLDTSPPARPPGALVAQADPVAVAPGAAADQEAVAALAPVPTPTPTLQEALAAAREALATVYALLPPLEDLEEALEALEAAYATVDAFLPEDICLEELGTLVDGLKEVVTAVEQADYGDPFAELGHVAGWIAAAAAEGAAGDAAPTGPPRRRIVGVQYRTPPGRKRTEPDAYPELDCGHEGPDAWEEAALERAIATGHSLPCAECAASA